MTLAYHLRHFHDKFACARCGKSFATRATFGRHVATHLSALNCYETRFNNVEYCIEQIVAPPNPLGPIALDAIDAPRSAAESRDQCEALGSFPGVESFAGGAWRWHRPAPRAWFALNENTSSCENAPTRKENSERRR